MSDKWTDPSDVVNIITHMTSLPADLHICLSTVGLETMKPLPLNAGKRWKTFKYKNKSKITLKK